MNYLQLNKASISEGIGVRTVLYVAGCCPNKCEQGNCPNCHNREGQNFASGEEFTKDTLKQLMSALDHDYIKGLTLCGGEPFDQSAILILTILRTVKEKFPEKDIWCYTGYELVDLLPKGKKYVKEVTPQILDLIDVLVVGPYLDDQRDVSDANRWRGSLNQKVLDMKESIKYNKPISLVAVPNNEIL